MRNNINYYCFIESFTYYVISSSNLRYQHYTWKSCHNNKEDWYWPHPTKLSTYYEDKIFSAIKYIRDRKQWPDVDAIFKYIAKNETSNISKDFIEDSMTKLLQEGKAINKKTSEGIDSFYSNIKNQKILH